MKLKLILFFTTILFIGTTYAQTVFNGVLINNADSSALIYAVIHQVENDKYTTTDDKGQFHFSLTKTVTVLHFDVNTIGFKGTLSCNSSDSPHRFYITVNADPLSEIVINGLSARQVVEKATATIQNNYIDSSYAAYSFYRQYEKLNGKFHNLAEAQSVVLFRLSKLKKEISCVHSYAIEHMRRSDFKLSEGSTRTDVFVDLMKQNPVYNSESGILNSKSFYAYRFNFDTVTVTDDYIIHFYCSSYSGEHGSVENYNEVNRLGENYATGTFIIDRETFAFKRIEINAFRHPEYDYPGYDNFIWPAIKYYEKFSDGHLVVEYENTNGKWITKKLLHQYSYEVFEAVTGKKEFTYTNAYEWTCDSITKVVPAELFNDFYDDAQIPLRSYQYEKQFWINESTPFYFSEMQQVMDDIKTEKTPEEQFEIEGH